MDTLPPHSAGSSRLPQGYFIPSWDIGPDVHVILATTAPAAPEGEKKERRLRAHGVVMKVLPTKGAPVPASHPCRHLVVSSIVFSCAAQGCGPDARTDAPDAGFVLDRACALASVDPQASELLRPRSDDEGFALQGNAWVSRAWRGARELGYQGLGVRVPVTADAPAEVGLSTFDRWRLRFAPEGARAVQGTLDAGRLVFPGAYGPSADLVMASSRDTFEEFIVLRDGSAPREYAWTFTLPEGIARVEHSPGGGLGFHASDGQLVLGMPAPYAIDASGKTVDVSWDWDPERLRLSIRIDPRTLQAPALLDPAFRSWVWGPHAGTIEFLYETAIAYDRERAQVALFGGGNVFGGQDSSATWFFDDYGWKQLQDAGKGPPGRGNAAIAYDTVRRQLVLFGGSALGDLLNDTWVWSGGLWSKVNTAVSPPKQANSQMAFDEVAGVVVHVDDESGTTWLFDGTAWSQTSAPAVQVWQGHGMVWDAVSKRVVLVDNFTGVTWTWEGTQWKARQTLPASMSPSSQHIRLAYDPSTKKVVTWADGDLVSWSLAAGWSEQPAPIPGIGNEPPVLVYDESSSRLLAWGGLAPCEFGYCQAGTWWWTGSQWQGPITLVTPESRTGAAMGVDEERQLIVLFGGKDTYGSFLDDTWFFDGLRWDWLAPDTSPTARAGAEMAWDSSSKKLVLFGGEDEYEKLAGTWTWDGSTWEETLTGLAPPVRTGHAMASDPSGGVLLYGGSDAQAWGDFWRWDGEDWWLLDFPPPGELHHHSMASGGGKVLLCSGPYDAVKSAWSWDGTDWSSEPAPPGSGNLVYDPTLGRFLLMVNDNVAVFDGTKWSVEPSVGRPQQPMLGMAWYPRLKRTVAVTTDGSTWTMKSHGGGCSTSAECHTGWCVDGVCCESPACGTCRACDVAGKAGVCSPVISASDDDTCGTSQKMACDAKGDCKRAAGQACASEAECSSGHCVDGVCCTAASCGTCQVCGAPSGTCVPAAAGSDPHSDCADQGSAACAQDGACDGLGACSNYAVGTLCGTPVCSNDGAQSYPQRCLGKSNCGPDASGTGIKACYPYLCDPAGGDCRTSCTTGDQCAAGAFCDSTGHCQGARVLGEACQADADCGSEHCADGVCCESECKDACRSCRGEKTGKTKAEDGICGFIPASTDPDDECGAEDVSTCGRTGQCDGKGTCAVYDGDVCAKGTCVGGSSTPASTCKNHQCVAAEPVPCAGYVCKGDVCGAACDSNADCQQDYRCDTAKHACEVMKPASCDPLNPGMLVNPDGTTTDCSPYLCEGSTCRTSCNSVDDCAKSNICDSSRHCVAAAEESGEANEDSGCGCRTGPARTTGFPGAVIALGLVALRRWLSCRSRGCRRRPS